MLIDLDVTQGEWFPFFGSHIDQQTGDVVYDEPADPNVGAEIRSTAPFFEEKMKSLKRGREHVFNPKTRGMDRVTFFKEQTFDEIMGELDEMYDYAITNLKGFKNKRTKILVECTKENKVLLRHNEVFKRYFERCQQLLHGDSIKDKEDEKKTSLMPQDGQ